jgi:predicted membrane protein
MLSRPTGQANLTAIAVLLGTVIAGVWVWKRLSLETQDYILDEALPMAVLAAIGLLVVWGIGRSVHRRKDRLRRRAFALIEANEYRVEGLESVVPALKELFATTLERAVGDKQHRLRGMAASHIGVLQDLSVVPLLIKALEDDHAYVRSCAALALGRLRATETIERLTTVMKDDWDQTVRSRAKEALARMGA